MPAVHAQRRLASRAEQHPRQLLSAALGDRAQPAPQRRAVFQPSMPRRSTSTAARCRRLRPANECLGGHDLLHARRHRPATPDGTLSPTAIEYPAVNITNTLIRAARHGNISTTARIRGRRGGRFTIPILGRAVRASLDLAKRRSQTDRWRTAAGGGDFITTYFRRAFSVTNPASSQQRSRSHDPRRRRRGLHQRPARDSSNMPADPINISTPAFGVVGSPAENQYTS